MKSRLIAAVALGSMMLIGSQSASAAFSGSVHDTGIAPTTGSYGCGNCHIPHGGDSSIAGLPMWGWNAKTATAYRVYGATTAGATGTTSSGTPVYGTVNGPTRACLTCHDGTAATFRGTGAAPDSNGPATGGGTMGLSDDHPVGVVYTALTATAKGLKAPATATFSVPGAAPTAPLGSMSNHLYSGGNSTAGQRESVECGTCHDVHNTSATGKLLRVTSADLCSTCHVK